MTPALQLRLWWRRAPLAQRAFTVGVLTLVLALLIASLPHGDGARTSAAGGQQSLSAQDNNVPSGPNTATPGDVGAGSDATGGGSAPVAAGGATADSNGGGGGSAPVAGPVPVAGAAPTAATGPKAAATPTRGGTKTTTSPAKGAGASPAMDISKATDRGVNGCSTTTKPCVKIGVLLPNLGGLSQAGFALGQRTDAQQVVQAFFNYQNLHGGINGRFVEPDFRSTDPVDEGDQNTACTKLTADDKVFGVIDTAALIFATTQKCFVQDNLTPYIHSYAEDAAFQAKSNGYELTETRNLDRVAAEWNPLLSSTGFIKKGDKVGILEDNCEPSATIVRTVLIPGVMKAGAASAKVYQSDCTAASAQSQPPGFAPQMCTDGVNRVLLATSFVASQTFLQAANATPCGVRSSAAAFQYMASDYSLNVSDGSDANYNPTQFDGALGITNDYTGMAKAGKPAPAKLAFCNKALSEGTPSGTTIPPLAMDGQNADTDAFCDYFFLMVDIATRVGGNLTRAAWAHQAANYGQFVGIKTPLSIFSPGKYSGGEKIQIAHWHASCTCWQSDGDFMDAAG